MRLMDHYLGSYQFSERHALDIPAPPHAVMPAVRSYDAGSDPFFRQMIALRELPMRALGVLSGKKVNPSSFGMQNFTVLEQQGDEELVFGLIGKFWQLDYGQHPFTTAAEFLAFDQPDFAKLTVGFQLKQLGDDRTRLTTETRVHCLSGAAHKKFAPYWYLIRPVSGLIRQRILSSIRRSVLTAAG